MGNILTKFEDTLVITAIRNKTLILPKINEKLECV